MQLLNVFNASKITSLFKLEYFTEKVYANFSSKKETSVKSKIVRVDDYLLGSVGIP